MEEHLPLQRSLQKLKLQLGKDLSHATTVNFVDLEKSSPCCKKI